MPFKLLSILLSFPYGPSPHTNDLSASSFSTDIENFALLTARRFCVGKQIQCGVHYWEVSYPLQSFYMFYVPTRRNTRCVVIPRRDTHLLADRTTTYHRGGVHETWNLYHFPITRTWYLCHSIGISRIENKNNDSLRLNSKLNFDETKQYIVNKIYSYIYLPITPVRISRNCILAQSKTDGIPLTRRANAPPGIVAINLGLQLPPWRLTHH